MQHYQTGNNFCLAITTDSVHNDAILLNSFFASISFGVGEGEGEVAFFSAKGWDRRNRGNLIESTTPCHDAQVVGPYRVSNPLRLTALTSKQGLHHSTTAPQHHSTFNI